MTTTEILTGIKTWVLNKLSLKQDVISDLTSIRSGSRAGSTAVQPSDLSSYFNNASYDTNTHRINFYHGQNIVAYIDASPFIVDGMINDVRIESGYLVIDFNTDSGKQDISIPLTDIFDPSNYYNKTQTDDLLAQKQDMIQDLANIRGGAQAGSTAVQPSTLNDVVKNMVAESGVYDVSANNDNTKFESLSALLNSANLNTLIPTDIRKGGMSIKFVQSSDNKYVQYRLMADEFTTGTTQWATADEGVYVENPEFVYVKTDAEGKILWAIKANGSIYYGAGVPQQVKDYIEEKISSLSLDEYEDIVAFLSDYLGGDATLKSTLDTINASIASISANKVDKEEGKSLVDAEYADSVRAVENPEFMEVELDADDKVLSGRKSDGTKFENNDVELNSNATVGGSLEVDGVIIKNIEDPEGRLEIATDSENKIISYRKKDGTLVENAGIETNHLELTEQGMTDFQQALKESGFKPGGTGDWSDYISNNGDKPLHLPIPTFAIVNITNDTHDAIWPTSKEGMSDYNPRVNADLPYYIEYYDFQGNYFKKKIIYTGQGNSSMGMPKKNGALDLFDQDWGGDALSIRFGNWVPQESYQLKAFYLDLFRCVCPISYKLDRQVMDTLPPDKNVFWKRFMLPPIGTGTQGMSAVTDYKLIYDNGAKNTPDAFPCKVFLNGEFYGIYSFQLKKHRDNYQMSKKKPLHIHLDGAIRDFFLYNGTIDWDVVCGITHSSEGLYDGIEFRNPKPKKKKDGWDLTCVDGSKYDGDTNRKELIGEFLNDGVTPNPDYDPTNESHVKTNITKEAFRTFSTYIPLLRDMENNDDSAETIRAEIETLFDVQSIIDYIVTGAIVMHNNYNKNWQWITYDGIKWGIALWDCDGTFGWDGWGEIPPTSGLRSPVTTLDNPVAYVYKYFKDEVESRYAELRDKKVFETGNIWKLFTTWFAAVGEDNYEIDIKKWPCDHEHYSPLSGTHYDNVYRVFNWINARIAKCDVIFNYTNQ